MTLKQAGNKGKLFRKATLSAKQMDQGELAEQTSKPTMHLFSSIGCGLKR